MVNEWRIKKLGEIAEIRMCKRIFAEQTTQSGNIPFFKIGTFGRKPDAYISQELYEEYRNKYSFPNKGDILLSAAGTLGRTVIYDGKPAYFQDSNIVWLEIDEKKICNEFLYHYYQTIVWLSREGSTISRLYNEIIRDTEIILPSLIEQRYIATVLSDVGAYLNSLKKLIAKKHAIKQGTMQELLTGKRRLPGFYGGWAEKRIDEIATVLKGRGLSKAKLNPNGKYFSLLYGELFTTYCEVIKDVKSRTDYEEGILSQVGDVLLPASTTTTGIDLAQASALCKNNVLIGGDINIIRPDMQSINSIFLAYTIKNTKKKEIAVRSKGITVYHLHGKDLLDMTIAFPPTKKEQTAIVEILLDMDAEIDTLTEKLNKVRNIKQGMMQELLTGRIRLIDEKTGEEIAPRHESAAKIIKRQMWDVQLATTQLGGHNQQFDDAVIIAGIVNALYSDKYPLGRKKIQKCLYLLRRYRGESTVAFKKKAAGPYADEVRYKGGEPIAIRQGYIQAIKGKRGTKFIKGANIQKALQYLSKWGRQNDIQWVVDNLKFKSVDELELLTTVDMAICDLEEGSIPISAIMIKLLIGTDAKWKAKLKKQIFSDQNISRAIQELQTLLERGD